MRLVLGLINLIVAVLLLIYWAWPSGGWVAWLTTAAVAALGAFQVFEGWSGWCAIRAMGIKTRV